MNRYNGKPRIYSTDCIAFSLLGRQQNRLSCIRPSSQKARLQYQCARMETVIQPLLDGPKSRPRREANLTNRIDYLPVKDAAGGMRASPFLQTQELQANARCAYRASSRYFNIRRVKQ